MIEVERIFEQNWRREREQTDFVQHFELGVLESKECSSSHHSTSRSLLDRVTVCQTILALDNRIEGTKGFTNSIRGIEFQTTTATEALLQLLTSTRLFTEAKRDDTEKIRNSARRIRVSKV